MPRMPLTVAALLNPNKTYRPEVLAAVKAFKQSKPWRGTTDERREKLCNLHNALCAVYELADVALVCTDEAGDEYDRRAKTITLGKALSVVTYFHLFTLARGAGRREAFAWSLNLFQRTWPRSFERLDQVGPYLKRRTAR